MATGNPTNRSHIDLPTEVSSEILQKTQEQSAIMQLARQITLPGWGLTIPVITGDPEAEWVSETGVKPVKNPSLDKKVMQAYKLAVIVPFSNEFKRDAKALYDALVGRLPLSLAQKFDATVFHGAAPGSNFDTMADCTAQSIANANNGTYLGLVAADADIADHNGMGNKTLTALKDKLKKGDVVMVDDNKSGEKGSGGHIFIVTGEWDKSGNPYIWDNESASRIKKGKSGRHTYSGKRKVLAVVRMK